MGYLSVMPMMLDPVAPTGFDAILAQFSNLSSVVGSVFGIITSNQYLAYMAVVGIVIAAIRIFKKLKKAAR